MRAFLIRLIQTSDFQSVRLQGQVSFRINDAEKTASMLNYSIAKDGESFISDDPMKLSDRVIRTSLTYVFVIFSL